MSEAIPVLEAFIANNVEYNHQYMLTDEVKIQLKQNLLLALFQQQGDNGFRKNIKRIFAHYPESIQHYTSLRTKLMNDEFINRKYKLALIHEMQGVEMLKRAGLSKETFAEARTCLKNTQKQKIKKLVDKIPIDYPSPKHQDKLLHEILTSTESFLGKFVYRKLRFICDSNRYHIDDLVKDLQEKMVQTARWKYPFLTPEHTLNCCKQSARNAGINLISHWTSKKRVRLYQDEEGNFVNNQVLLTDDIAIESPADGIHSKIAYHQMERHFEDLELLLFRLITINEDCTPFLRWACKELDQYFDSIEAVVDYLGFTPYLKLIAQYVEKPEKYVDRFLKKIQTVYSEVG